MQRLRSLGTAVNTSAGHILSTEPTRSAACTLMVGTPPLPNPDPPPQVTSRTGSGPERGEMFFAGLRFADNQYVFGRLDVQTGSVELISNTGRKWLDFQSFKQ